MTRKEAEAILKWVRLPEGYVIKIAYPVTWKQWKKHYPKAKKVDYLDYAVASTDPVEKIIYVTPLYIPAHSPMTLINTLCHELGHVYQKSTVGGPHNRNWITTARNYGFDLEDEYMCKKHLHLRKVKDKEYRRNFKNWLRTQRVQYGYGLSSGNTTAGEIEVPRT